MDRVASARARPDDIPQREAGERLAQILSTAGIEIAPAGHRHILRAQQSGLLKIDASALQRLNGIQGIAVFTLRNDTVVGPGAARRAKGKETMWNLKRT
jgi:hypothetical protein